MSTLIVAATAFEIAPLLPALSMAAGLAGTTSGKATSAATQPSPGVFRSGRFRDDRVDVLVTGVGMVSTAVWCSRILAEQKYDLALNLGVCGSFDRSRPLGSVVHVVSDQMPELGAEDGEAFLPLGEMKLLEPDQFPYAGGRLTNAHPIANAALNRLPKVHGVTVNTVHGHDPSIARVKAQTAADVESMEGAAFYYACLVAGVACAQVRAISNIVERRNRVAWRLPEAIASLGDAALAILEDQ